MAVWTRPKTNWFGATVNGVYTGDRWSADDYNRITGNLNFLNERLAYLYVEFNKRQALEAVGYDSYPTAAELNDIESALRGIEQFMNADFGGSMTFQDNGAFIDYNELNRIEGSLLAVYKQVGALERRSKTMQFTLSDAYVFASKPSVRRNALAFTLGRKDLG